MPGQLGCSVLLIDPALLTCYLPGRCSNSACAHARLYGHARAHARCTHTQEFNKPAPWRCRIICTANGLGCWHTVAVDGSVPHRQEERLVATLVRDSDRSRNGFSSPLNTRRWAAKSAFHFLVPGSPAPYAGQFGAQATWHCQLECGQRGANRRHAPRGCYAIGPYRTASPVRPDGVGPQDANRGGGHLGGSTWHHQESA